MTITIDLNAEETSAMQAIVDARNAASGTAVTIEQHLTEIVSAEILTAVRIAYDRSVDRLRDAARELPYETRVALIESVEAHLS